MRHIKKGSQQNVFCRWKCESSMAMTRFKSMQGSHLLILLSYIRRASLLQCFHV